MRLIFTTVIRAADLGDAHGGLYVLDCDSQEIVHYEPCTDNFSNENERGGERGLRGISVQDDRIYVAGSNSIRIIDPNNYSTISSIENSEFLNSIHEICYFDDSLWVTSTGINSIVKLSSDLKIEDVWHIKGVMHDSHHTVEGKERIESTDGIGDDIHINSISAHNGRVVFAGSLTPLYDFNTLEEVQDLAIGGFTHNFEEFPDVVLANKTYVRRLEVVSDYDRILYPIPLYSGDLIEAPDEIAKPDWLRGMARKDNLVFLGCSPARILVFDLDKRMFIQEINLSNDARCCIHGIDTIGV